MSRRHRNLLREIRVPGAWFCLLAIAMLWTPLIATAWTAHQLACCNGNVCLAKTHNHGYPAESKSAAHSGAPMDCDHSLGARPAGTLMNCEMSCCHQQEKAISPVMIFVIPQIPVEAHLAHVPGPVRLLEAHQVFISFAPPSPPPKSSSSLA